jgi:O-antigen/teichoic acid export membrane protein
VQKLFSSQALLWAGRGFWAVADQAIFAGTNFLVSILLARWLEPAAYGAFSTAYALFLLLGTLHTGLWTEPMLVYGSGRFREVFSAYQALLIRYHWRFGLLVFVVFLVLGGLFWSLKGRELALSFLGLSVAAPAVLYLWLVRRGAYVHLNPRLAALGGGLYLFLFLGLAGFLFRARLLNEATVFLAMALASALAAEAIRWRLRGRAPTQVAPSEVWALHWGYGRWALLAGALSWILANLPLVALGGLKGLEAAGVFRAAYNLFMPVLHFQTALNALFFPLIARVLHQQGEMHARRWIPRVVLVHLAPASAYILLGLFAGSLAQWVYGGRYPEVASLFLWMLPLPFFAAFSNALEAWYRSLERPQAVAVAYGVSAGVTVLGLAAISYWGVSGAVGLLLAAKAALVLVLCRR